jgi:hypothetical protein
MRALAPVSAAHWPAPPPLVASSDAPGDSDAAVSLSLFLFF